MEQYRAADRYLEAEGQPRLRYRDEGAGPTVVLVHGWLLDLTMWDQLANALSGHFRILRIDRRGFGASAGTPNLAADATDILRLLEHLNIRRAAALGMSQGTRIALSVAEAAPARVACLVLDGPPPLEGLPDRQWQQETPIDQYRALLLEKGIEALRTHLRSHPLLQLHADDPAARRTLADMLRRYEGADLLAAAGAPATIPPDRFSRLQLPVLVLNGALDTEQRLRVGEALCECIANSERRIVPNARHLACWDNPAAYGGFVLEFFKRHLDRWA